MLGADLPRSARDRQHVDDTLRRLQDSLATRGIVAPERYMALAKYLVATSCWDGAVAHRVTHWIDRGGIMIDVADNAKGCRATARGAVRGSAIARRRGGPSPASGSWWGTGCFALAIVLWSLRDTVPSWMAEPHGRDRRARDHHRARRCPRYPRLRRGDAMPVGATRRLESLPNQTKVRHTPPHRAGAEQQRSDRAGEPRWRWRWPPPSRNEGDGTLSVDIRRRTTPIADRTTAIARLCDARRRRGRGPFRRRC